MVKVFLIAAVLLASARSFAQQMIRKQIGFEISYAVYPQSPAKQNYALNLGLVSYAKNGNYFFTLAAYSSKNVDSEKYAIPVEIFLLNPGYSLYLWGDLMRNVNINFGVGGLAGYEMVNNNSEALDDGSRLYATGQLIYGANAKLSIESYLSGHWVFLVSGQLRFFQNSQLPQFQSLLSFGIRYNF